MKYKIHNLKTSPIYFKATVEGTKKFEVRRNDRNFKTGDFLCLEEFDDKGYTGKYVHVEVIYILSEPTFVKKDHVIMGIELRIHRGCTL